MSLHSHLAVWSLFAACLAISFVLSGMETGVFALSRLRIRQQMRAGRPSARVLHEYLEHPENFLWTILVGNTVANSLILGWLVFILHRALEGSWAGFAVVFAVCVFFFYTFLDLLPKMLFRLFPNRLTLLCARPFRVIHLLLRPLVALVETVSGALLRWRGGAVFTGRLFGNREELRLLMQESAPALTTEESGMINRVLDLPSLTVRQVMTPIEQAASVPAHATVAAVLEVAKERNHTRLPVWDQRDGQVRVVGLVSLNTLLFQSPPPDLKRLVTQFITPALYLDEDARLEVALRRMQRGGQRLAIVLSREKREIGIISLQDVLRVIFGEVSL
jgi:CBS domain containing-hemolysin-like protein